MPRLYRFITAFLAFAGCVSLAVSGELNPVFFMPGLAMIYGYARYISGGGPLSRSTVGGLSITALVVLSVDALIISADFFLAVAHMTVLFQAIKSFDLREPWDHLQVYFMSLLQLVMTSELTSSLIVGAIFVVFLTVQIIAMVFSHFIKEGTLQRARVRRPLFLISVCAVLATAVFFVSVPRIKGGFLGRKSANSIRSIGFTEKVGFGSMGNVLVDRTIVMRAEVSGGRLPLYWRGITLNHFDGLSWKDTTGARKSIEKTGGKFAVRSRETGGLTVQKIFIEPIDTSVVFGLGDILTVEASGKVLLMDEAGALFLPAKSDRRFSYTVMSVPESGVPVMPITHMKRYLQIPPGMEKIIGLARQISGSGANFQKARRIEDFLRTNYRYSLSVAPPAAGMTPIEDFLFVSKEGFCEHYATTMVLMLRAVGIPSRIVTGFMGGEENDYGDYVIVRQSNAHSWVEALMDGRWRRFDPTPAEGTSRLSVASLYLDSLRMKWYRYVVGFSSYDQITLIRSLSMPVVFNMPELGGIRVSVRPGYIIIALCGFVFIAAAFTIKRPGIGRRTLETRLYLRFKEGVRRDGGLVGPSSTASEVMREALRLNMNGDAVGRFIGLYEDSRFGGKDVGGDRLKAAYRLLR